MKKYGRMKERLHSLQTTALDGDELSASSSSCFTSGKRSPMDRRQGVPQSQSVCGDKVKSTCPY
jgi:hypothetical protein